MTSFLISNASSEVKNNWNRCKPRIVLKRQTSMQTCSSWLKHDMQEAAARRSSKATKYTQETPKCVPNTTKAKLKWFYKIIPVGKISLMNSRVLALVLAISPPTRSKSWETTHAPTEPQSNSISYFTLHLHYRRPTMRSRIVLPSVNTVNPPLPASIIRSWSSQRMPVTIILPGKLTTNIRVHGNCEAIPELLWAHLQQSVAMTQRTTPSTEPRSLRRERWWSKEAICS